MKVLVWHLGRRGAGPRVAAEMAAGLAIVAGVDVRLSLSAQADLLTSRTPPVNHLPIDTYTSVTGFLARAAQSRWLIKRLVSRLAEVAPDVALCAMPAPLDFVMSAALRRSGVPFHVVIHDAEQHPGDGFPMQMDLQRHLMRDAAGVVALSPHVAGMLRDQGVTKTIHVSQLPPLAYAPPADPPRWHGGPLRLLSFGRLLSYKGLDLLAETLDLLGPRSDLEVRVVGSGPESKELRMLRSIEGVTVENRWVPEDEVAGLLAWSDALVLTHREASQSGVAAAAVAAGRWIVSTRVGGITEQLRDVPDAVLCDVRSESLADALFDLLQRPPAQRQPHVDPMLAWRDAATDLAETLRASLSSPAHPRPA